ncbi:GNAT family N-acetyltransferase [Sphingomonas aracearum]|uniref:GNAT family N-acetyltransferase n=1 Tax=Sphingomonas aracearum TaxID=2283317 RepID=UPI0026D053ED
MILRPARAEDAGQIAAIYAPHVLTGTVTFEIEVPDAAEIRARMESSAGLYPWIVAAEAGAEATVLGYAYAFRFRERAAYGWVVETSIYVSAAAQGRGTGRLLYQALVDTLRAQGFAQAIGVIALPNDASVRLHEQVGFRHAGFLREVGYKHGRWTDVGYWQCELAERTVPAPPPRRFADTGIRRG